jgi:four helix bundle protein
VKVVKIKKFEDLESWKKARAITNAIYEATAAGRFSRDFGLKDQVRRASISILSNIAEGFERGGDKEFLQFLAVAKGSCGEVRAQLYIAIDKGISVRNFLRNSPQKPRRLADSSPA